MTATGTTITAANAPEKGANDTKKYWEDAIAEYTGYTFVSDTALADIKLKSKNWKLEKTIVGTKDAVAIGALVTVKSDGSVTVEYDPDSVKDGTSGK